MKWYRVHLMNNSKWLECEHVKHFLIEAETESDAITNFALLHWDEIQAFKRRHGVMCDVQASPENRPVVDGKRCDVSGKLVK